MLKYNEVFPIKDFCHSRDIRSAEPNVFCTADDARTCLRWAEEGLGAALVPESICPPAGTADGGLVCLPLSERELATELTLVVKKGRVLSPDTKVLFEMM